MTFPLSSLILFLHIGSAMVLVGNSLFAPLVRSALSTARTVAWPASASPSGSWRSTISRCSF